MTKDELDAVWLSVEVALAAVACSLPVAVAVAWLLSRPRLPGRALLAALVYLPLVLPPVVTGYILLLLFGRHGPIGAWLESWFGLVFAFRWTGAALAAAVMGFPLMVRSMQLGFEAVDRRLEQAAASLGAPPLAVFLTVTLPLSAPGILAGALLSFAKSLGEFGATVTFVSNIPGETRTLSVAIYSLLQVPGGDAAVLRLAMLSMILSLAGVFGSEFLSRRLRRSLGPA